MKKKKKRRRKASARTSIGGSRVSLNVHLHRRLLALLDEERGLSSRRVWLEQVLCAHFAIPEQELIK